MRQRGSPNTKLMRETNMFAPRSVHVIGTNQFTIISAHTSILPNDNNGKRRETPWRSCLYPFSPNHGNSKASKQMRITIDTMADSSSCYVHMLLRRRRRESMMRCNISLNLPTWLYAFVTQKKSRSSWVTTRIYLATLRIFDLGKEKLNPRGKIKPIPFHLFQY